MKILCNSALHCSHEPPGNLLFLGTSPPVRLRLPLPRNQTPSLDLPQWACHPQVPSLLPSQLGQQQRPRKVAFGEDLPGRRCELSQCWGGHSTTCCLPEQIHTVGILWETNVKEYLFIIDFVCLPIGVHGSWSSLEHMWLLWTVWRRQLSTAPAMEAPLSALSWWSTA